MCTGSAARSRPVFSVMVRKTPSLTNFHQIMCMTALCFAYVCIAQYVHVHVKMHIIDACTCT